MTSIARRQTISGFLEVGRRRLQTLAKYSLVLKWGALGMIALAVLKLGEVGDIRTKVLTVPIAALLLFGGLGLLARVFYSLRWKTISASLDIDGLNLGYALRIGLLSEFVSIVLPSYLGGDGVRLLKLRDLGSKNRDVIASILMDRLVGLLTLALLTALFLPFLLPYLPIHFTIPPVVLPFALGGLSLLVVIATLSIRRWGRSIRVPELLAGLTPQPKPLVMSILFSLLGHLLYVTGYAVLFRALTLVPLELVFSITFLALLTQAVPLSIFGIDVSDGSIVVLASLVAIPPTISLAVVALLVISRYGFAVSGLVIELIIDGRRIFVRRTSETA